MVENIIEISNLAKTYQGKKVLQNVNFVVKKGTIHGFIGPNGAGKTTVIRSLMGGTRPNAGQIYLAGRKIQEDNHVNQRIGFMTETVQFAGDLTVEDFCQLSAKLRNIAPEKLANRLQNSDLNQFRKKRCRDLSTGWKKILLYFIAVMHEPDILVLDEPTSGLDPSYQRILLNQLERVRSRGGTVLISSHILSDLQKLVDFVTLIDKGKIVYTGEKPADIEKIYNKLVSSQEKKIAEKKDQTWI